MSRFIVVGEDQLCCALGKKMAAHTLPKWQLALPPIDTRGVTKLQAALHRYIEQARHVQPVLCIADTDNHCALAMLKTWLPDAVPRAFGSLFARLKAGSWPIGKDFRKRLAFL